MLWAYILENGNGEDQRDNSPLFQLINEMEVEEDNLFFDMDTCVERSELQRLLVKIPSESRLIIRSVLDLADSIEELVDTLSVLSEKQIVLCSCMESFLSGLDYIEQLTGCMELIRYYKKRKQEVAYKKAVAEGRVGRPTKATEIEKAIDLYNTGKLTFEQMQALSGVSRSTLYRRIKENREKN